MAVQSQEEARDALAGLVTAAWAAAAAAVGMPSAPLLYDDVDGDPPGAPALWGRLSLQFDTGARVTLGNDSGAAMYRNGGQLFVQVFTPHGEGPRTSDRVVEALKRALQHPGHVDGVRIRNVSPQPGESDGAWFQVNVFAEFQFDRIQ